MLWQLFNKLGMAGMVFFRTIRAFFNRRISAIYARFRQMTNVSRGATKLATTSIQNAAVITQKPTKREDYIEAGSLLVSKSFIIKIIIAIVVAILLVYFVIWPFVLSHFLTAKFYMEDRKIESWNGRVIVYSDKKKTIPLYSGKLEDGKLQGKGKEYDEDGILSYEGEFVDGVRAGQGTSYEDGVMIYKGEFAEGIASGKGTAYDHKTGVMTYQGDFSEGLPEGTGKAYKNGAMVYQGEFSAGKYNGKGTLYPAEGEELAATFKDGVPDSTVTWSKSGKTYYQGEWDSGRPEGYGTLYSKSGKTLYQGQMLGGTLDGTWLLSLTLDELKEALGDAQTSSSRENAQFFLLSSSELGLVARCSYQTEETESQVHSVYLFTPKGETWFQLLPGQGGVRRMAKNEITDRKIGPLQFNAPKGVDVKSGTYSSDMLFTESERITLLRPSGGGDTVLLTWSRLDSGAGYGDGGSGSGSGGSGGSGGADGSGGGAGGGSSEEEMGSFLDSLDGMQGAGGVDSVPNEYCGDKPASGALNACTTPEQLSALVNALTDYWLQSETQAGLEENLSRVQGQLDDANAGNGMGSSIDTSGLEKSKVTLEGQITSCENRRAKAQVEAKEAAGIDPAEYSAGDILVQFDPTTLDVNSLVPMAAAYAKSTGKETDSAALETQIKSLLVDMKDAYNRIQSSVESCRLASDESKSATNKYAMGNSDKSTWFSALSGEVDAELQVYSAAAEFTKYANQLNTVTGGWVSRNCNWYRQEMTYVFESVMQKVSSEEEETSTADSSKAGATSAETSSAGTSAAETSKTETSSAETSSAETSEGMLSENDTFAEEEEKGYG